MKNRLRKISLIMLFVTLAAAVGAPTTATAQAGSDLMQISSDLSRIISTKSFFDTKPGVSAQQEWLHAGCEVNFKMVVVRADDKIVIEYHFMLDYLGGVLVTPTGTGGFTVKISSSDGTARIPKISEIWKQGVVSVSLPTYDKSIEFRLNNRDDAYHVADMLRTAIAACR